MNDAFRLWDRLLVGDGCWEWQGAKSNGYGRIGWRFDGQPYRMVVVPRLAYMLWHDLDEIPPGKQVNHHCDNKACARPDHLYLGTKRENWLDASERGGWVPYQHLKTHCPQGHPYDAVRMVRGKPARSCRTCEREAQHRYRNKQRGR